ncbi:MAG TPA: polymer-forming cytoskeletal protein, partial [Candidatus Paceibacterota bacterium]|nr:polymer-forming cytoskeletal protein [Candidatus Paceibacterota bacterium]
MNPDFQNQAGSNQEWLSMSEAAAHTPYSAEYLSLLARKKKLAAKKVGKVWYTTKAILDEYMRRQMIRNQIQHGDMSSFAEKLPGATPIDSEVQPQPQPVSDMVVFSKRPIEQPAPKELEPEKQPALVPTTAPSVVVSDTASDHPLTKKVRTFHGDLKAYLDTLHAATKNERTPDPAVSAIRVEHIHVPDFFKSFKKQTTEEAKPAPASVHAQISPVVRPLPKPVSAPAPVPAPKAPEVAKVTEAAIPRPIAPAPVAPVGLDAIALTLSEISKRLEKIAETKAVPTSEVSANEIARVLESKLKVAQGEPNILTRSFRTVFGKKPLMYLAAGLVIFFSVFPTPFVSAFFDGAMGAVKKVLADADTVMGFRPGTHANEVLLLDKQGNVSIMGHIETDGQFRSYAKDGIAPIVVDSKTEVKNLNSEMVGGNKATDFTLAFVTKNGNMTTDDVFFKGNVEVGKTLLVRGAANLLSDLEVDGGLSVLGDARFSRSLSVEGPAYFDALLNATDVRATGLASLGEVITAGNIAVGKNATVRGSLTVGHAVIAGAGAFSSLSSSGDFSAKGEIALGNPKDTITIDSSNASLDSNGNLTLSGRADVSGNLAVGGILSATSANFSGTSTLAALTVSGTSTLAGLAVDFASATQAHVGTGVIDALTSTIASIASLVSQSVSVNALTATDTTAVNATSTNATTTNASITNAVVANATTTNEFVSNIVATNAAITQASLENAAITGVTIVSATTTNATTTNLAVSNLTATGTIAFPNIGANMLLSTDGNSRVVSTSSPQVAFINATSTTATSTFAGNVSVTGNLAFGNGIGTTLSINSSINSDLVPDINIVRNIGSPAFYWKNGYFDNLNVNNISAASSSIAGTVSNSFTINSANVSADTEDMQLIFKRGSVTPNALLAWNSTAKRFEFNQPVYIQNQTPGGNITTLDIQGNAGQTTSLFRVLSSTGENYLNVSNNGSLGLGTTSPFARLSVAGDAYIGGNLTATGTVSIPSITGSLLKTDSSGTVVAAIAGSDYAKATDVFGKTFELSGGYLAPTTTQTILANGGFVSQASSTIVGPLTLQNYTFVNGTGTNATTTNFYSTTASSTNLFAVNASFGSANISNLNIGGSVTYTGTGTTTFGGDINAPGIAAGKYLTAPFIWATSSSATNYFAGNVGIGTTTASSKLSVLNGGVDVGGSANSNGYLLEVKGSAASGGFLPFGNNVQAKAYSGLVNALTVGSAYFSTVPSDGSAIFSGNVGVGTSSPSQTLSVS